MSKQLSRSIRKADIILYTSLLFWVIMFLWSYFATLEEVTREADGKVRFVIAHQYPGVPNWLDPMGNDRGYMTLRWLDARGESVPIPVVTRVALSELAGAL